MEEPPARSGRLDASGPREVVYCHECEHEWYKDARGLTCPRCGGVVTEIITPGGDDPRRSYERPPTPIAEMQNHNPWAMDGVPDPEEADIEEHIRTGPNGSTIFTRTTRSGPRTSTRITTSGIRSPADNNESDHVMRDFQDMIGSLMGPQFRRGTSGRSGPDTLFPPLNPASGAGGFQGGTFRIGGNNGGANVVGGRFTFTSPQGGQHNNHAGAQAGGPQIPDEIAAIMGNILGPLQGAQQGGGGGMAPLGGLGSLFASLLNPANARSGDAVYTQEALDQIISTLMEQAPTSNAPGPAPPDAIARLPKKKLDTKMLGPEGKGECSVCMDDVHTGDEVVVLPCTHWFHEACAGAWLAEHNTCPICRKGIDAEANATAFASAATGTTQNQPRSNRPSHYDRNEHDQEYTLPRGFHRITSDRNQARLDFIRGGGGRPAETPPESRNPDNQEDHHMPMPGSFTRRASDRSERRANTSGSDRSRRSSNSGSSGSNRDNSGTGPLNWLRRLGR